MLEEISVEQLFLESDNYPLIIETIISSMIQDKMIDFKISLLVINKIIDILDNYKIELDDKVIEELVFFNGLFMSIINCLSEYINIINDKSILSFIKKVNEYRSINFDDLIFNNTDKFQSVDGVKEYINSINCIPLLSAEEEKELALKVKNGDKDARKKFVESNLRLVLYVEKKYNGYELTYMDLIQEGNLALIFAVDRFDVSLVYRFSTFATIIINQKVFRAICLKGSQIRILEYLNKKIRLLKSTYVSLYNKKGSDITYSDLSNELGISVEEIEYLYSLQNSTLSINSKINEDDNSEIIDLIPSEDNIEDEYSKKDLLEKILLIIESSKLNDIEKTVIMLRYGLTDGKVWKLKEIGEIYGISGEKTRQIEERDLRKIRKSSYLKKIDDYTLKPGKRIIDKNKINM